MLTNKFKVRKHKNKTRSTSQQHYQRVSKYLRNIALAAGLLVLTVLIGVVGFMFIDNYSLSDAFYMTIITLSTVGYGEIQPLSFNGRLFTSFIIIFNIGIFAYAISVLSSFIIEGDLRKFMKDYRMYQKIQSLHNHTIICGFGRHGREISQELTKNKLPYVIIESDEEKVEELRKGGYAFIEGDAAMDQTLLDAGIEHAMSIVVTFGDDALNVYTVLTARELNKLVRVIARASNHSVERKLLRAGADYAVLSEVIGGFYMATLIYQPRMVEFLNLLSNLGNDVSMSFKEVDYKDLRPEFKDKQIRDLNLRSQTGVNIIGARLANGKYIINPGPDTAIVKGMSLVILGDEEQVETFERVVMHPKHRPLA
ncbi:potassium channel family protein [Saprospira grandis]|uniref:potassium channel family protein n=1 Tax=Saprospira grandis TaxID=1008 RepID=UPI0022DDD6AD|nr:potassium channel protein [Saprospira grandis]WBM73627.1 potassium channel protein [Saprospira grandis]